MLTWAILITVKSGLLKRKHIGPVNIVSQDRWSLLTGSVALKFKTFYQEFVVLQHVQDRWSVRAVVSSRGFTVVT